MFSHTINNSNNHTIQTSNYNAVPFGHRCASALACKYASIRKFSLPFDWTIPSLPGKIKQVLENNFVDFIPHNVHHSVFTNIYGFELAHFNPNITNGIDEYARRIVRFNNVMNDPSKKIYFVY